MVPVLFLLLQVTKVTHPIRKSHSDGFGGPSIHPCKEG
jgi:hypothetical protein